MKTIKCGKCIYSDFSNDCLRNETKNPYTGEYKSNSTDRSPNETGQCNFFKKRKIGQINSLEGI